MKKIFQIYYNDETKKSLDKKYIPLENLGCGANGFYEFDAIYSYLKSSNDDSSDYLGFLSPRFEAKTLVTSDRLIEEANDDSVDVYSISSAWDQIAYFRNAFYQGDYYHRGLLECSKAFAKYIDFPYNIDEIYSTYKNTIFSNYLIAKKSYWMEWLRLADLLLEFSKSDSAAKFKLDSPAHYYLKNVPMFVFMQERLHSYLLLMKSYNVYFVNTTKDGPLLYLMFKDDLETRTMLNECEINKNKYMDTGYEFYIDAYNFIRSKIETLVVV